MFKTSGWNGVRIFEIALNPGGISRTNTWFKTSTKHPTNPQ